MRTSTITMDQLRASRSLIITRTEAAHALGVDPRTVTVGIDNGTIPQSGSAAAWSSRARSSCGSSIPTRVEAVAIPTAPVVRLVESASEQC